MTNRLGGMGGEIGDRWGDRLATAPVAACGCAACRALGSDGPDDQGKAGTHLSASAPATDTRGFMLLPQYRNPDGSWSFSGDRNTDAVLIGTKWTGTSLTFGFPDSGAVYGSRYDMGQQTTGFAFNDLQKQAVRDALDLVSGYTNLTFTEVDPTEERPTLRFAQTDSREVYSALGHFPASPTPPIGQNASGDIWFGRTGQPFYTEPQKGNWGYTTILHEIGHTLGLKHGQDDYTAYDLGLELFDSSTPLYGTRAIEYAKDGQAWSLMSYSVAPGAADVFNGDRVNNAQSYMQFDIAALQYLYGANYATNAGDTVYRWDANTGEKFVNDVGQGAPTGNKVLETIWDGGGNDTYDLSNYGGGVVADLRPGQFLTLSLTQQANALAFVDGNRPFGVNVGNALLYRGDTRSLIENAIGGAGDDVLIGNQAVNVLVGNGGDDLLDGGEGSDTLFGGAGSDTTSFATATGGIDVTLNNGASDLLVANGADVDRLVSIESIIGTAYDDRLVGDAGDNMLSGGEGGADTLIGNEGDDRLVGGGYKLVHEERPDVLKGEEIDNGGRDRAVSLDGSFELAPREGVDVPGLPHATVVATSSSDLEYYRFEGRQGATVVADLDKSGEDLTVQILDAQGNIIAVSYASDETDDGSPTSADPYLTTVLPESGTYYVMIGLRQSDGTKFFVTPLPAGTGYTLNLSVEGATVPTPTMVSTASAVMDGGSGNDTMVATMGDDRIDGGSGVDTLSYRQAWRGVSVDLSRSDAQDTGAGIDTIRRVENVSGSTHADRLTGDARANVIDGGGGDDVLDGGAGIDTISFAAQGRGVAFDLARQGAGQATRLGESVVARNFENLTGTAFGDTLSGDAGSNTLDGGAGDDLLVGDSGGRIGGRDRLVGGADNDTASFAPYAAAIVGGLRNDGRGFVTADGLAIANLDGVENLTGGSGNDRLTGNDVANVLRGGAGADTLNGAGGDDWLDGGAGNDMLAGGEGIDTADYSGARDVTIDLRRTVAQDTGAGRDRLTGIENLALGGGSNRATGNAGDNVFRDGAGDDTIDGQGGIDTIDYSTATGRVTVDLSLTGAQDTGGTGTDILIGIENAVAGAFGSRITGSAAANRLVGGAIRDIMIGGDGADTLLGVDGNDVLIGDFNAKDEDIAEGSGRGDFLDGGQGSDILIGGDGDDTLLGGTGNDNIFGGRQEIGIEDDNSIFLNWPSSLDGGNDVIDGGDGLDKVYLEFHARSEGVELDLSESARRNILYSGGVAVGSVTNVEAANLIGGHGNDRFVGTAGYDLLDGGLGDDVLVGGLGDDVLAGGAGNDYLDGGEGIDGVDYRNFMTSGVTVDLRITTAQDTGGGGIDTLLNVEQIYTSAYTDVIHGSDENLDVYDYGGGDDRFYGEGGDDNLQVNRDASLVVASTIVLDGGDGNDELTFMGGALPSASTSDAQAPFRDTVTILGGRGDDRILVVSAKTATIDAGEGDDVVAISITGSHDDGRLDISLGTGRDEVSINWASADGAGVNRASYVVSDFVAGAGGDVLGLTGIISSALDVDIGFADPFYTGHVRLLKVGADTLLQADKDGRFGDLPWVTLLTLKDTDAFAFTRGNVYAAILTEGLRWTPVVYDPVITQIAAAAGGVLDGHDGRDDLVGAAGNDLLNGGAADDVLNGNAGDDVLDGGTGADYMIGGTGDDTFVVDDAGDYVGESPGEGTDTVVVRMASFALNQGVSIEVLQAGAGAGAVDLVGNELDQTLIGNEGANVLDGGDGVDTVSYRGAAGGIVLSAAAGTGLGGEAAGDTYRNIEAFEGSDHADTLIGGDAGVTLSGLGGNDTLLGGSGADRLDGGAGDDILVGGGGADRFVFADLGGRDVIADFASGIDLLDLTGIDAVAGGERDAFDWIGDRAFGGVAGELRAYVENGTAYVAGDVDGDGIADFRIVTNVLLQQSDMVLA